MFWDFTKTLWFIWSNLCPSVFNRPVFTSAVAERISQRFGSHSAPLSTMGFSVLGDPTRWQKRNEIPSGNQLWMAGTSPTWWFIPRIVSGLVHPSYKWTLPPLVPFITRVITHLLSGMNHQVHNVGFDGYRTQRIPFNAELIGNVWRLLSPSSNAPWIDPVHIPIFWCYNQFPDAPCMEYLPTFGPFLG